MIRPINIKLNAAHPELPLVEATTFTGAPSSVFIRGVPKAVGNWSITAVSVAVTYPDNTTTARAAVESAEGVWVATIPGTATSGRTAAGFKIMADGIDENGAAVTGYVLGFADFSVLSFTPVPAPGGTFWLLRYFDTVPSILHKADVAKIDGVLKFYNGTAWEPFATPPTLDDAVTRTSANGVKSSGIWSAIWGALAALPTGFTSLYDWCVAQLAGKVDDMDGEVNGLKITGQGTQGRFLIFGSSDFDVGMDGDAIYSPNGSDRICWVFGQGDTAFATRADIAPEYDGEEPHSYVVGQLVSYGEIGGIDTKIYRCTTAHTATSWVAANWALATVEDVLAALRTGKADVSAIPYALVTKTITNGAVSLDDRASNAVTVSATLSPNTLTINFPTAPTGKLRDFGLRLTVASGVTTAPQIVLPQGVVCENADGEAPEIGADGAATILYFTETASGVFLVKGEVVQTIN